MKRIGMSIVLLLMAIITFSQQPPKISGTITDSDTKLPIEGATIKVKGSSTSAISDKDGKFSISARPKDLLEITFVGYKSVITSSASSANGIVVKLVKEVKDLDDVVVVGYSTVQRKNTTGATSTLSAVDVQKASAVSAAEVLQGRVAGVQIISSDGSPGGGISINIRGNNSILAGGTPLLVVDGIPFVPPSDAGFNPFAVVNPNDIETLTVLKDAAATAQYGSEATNGVVLITTKKGKAGGAKVSLNSAYTVGNLVRRPAMMDFEQYAYSMKARIDNNPSVVTATLPPGAVYVNPWDAKIANRIWETDNWTDWLSSITQNTTVNNTSLSISGANNGTNYYFSGGYYNERGLLAFSGFKRYTSNFKLTQDVTSKLNVGFNLSYTKTIYDGLVNSWGGLNGNGLFGAALTQSPAVRKNDPYGDSLLLDPEFNANAAALNNPYTYIRDVTQDRSTNFFQGRIDVKYKVLKNLTWKNSLSLQSESRIANRFENKNTRDGRNNNGILNYQTYDRRLFVFQSQLNYNLRKGKNYFDLNAVFEAKETKTDEFAQRVTNITVPNLGYYAGVTSTLPQTGIRGYNANSKASAIGIFNYTYDNRYIFSASVRADGSSNFGPENQWGYFPAASLAWRLSNEKFFREVKGNWLSELKLRTSFGITGNDQIPPYQTIATYSILSANSSAQVYPFYNSGISQYGINVGASFLANPLLKWEQTSQFNAGLDISILKDKLTLTVDYYYKKTKDMLLRRTVSNYILPTNNVLLENRGSLQNTGLEFDLKGTIINKKDFSWNAGINISFNRNKVLYLGDDRYEFQFNGSGLDGRFFPIRVRVGESLGKFYGVVSDGVYNNTLDRANSPINNFGNGLGALGLVDTNGDGVVDRNDIVEIGSTLPIHTGGINTSISYKNFDLYIFGRWSYGNDVINANFDQATEARYSNNLLAILANKHWTTATPTNNYYALGASNRNNLGVMLSEYIENGSFFRLDRITLGYNLGVNALKFLKVKSFKLSASVENAFVFTKYSWFDPEVNTGNGESVNLGPGIDRSAYPRARRGTISLICNF